MAHLMSVRRLEPLVDLNVSESTTNLTEFDQDPECFQNPTFEADFQPDDEISRRLSASLQTSGDCPSSHNNNYVTHNHNNTHNHSKKTLTSSDSGIIIFLPRDSDDASSVGDNKSLDSGVCGDSRRRPSDSQPCNGHNGWLSHPSKRDSLKSALSDGKSSRDESLVAICVQVFIPFLIAGIGTCGAGIILDHVEGWEVFKRITDLYILVPTLLGLKGNLEMTLASRVSTQANLGRLNTLRDKWHMSWGNMALIQCQSTVLGLLAAAFAITMNIAKNGFKLDHALLLCASSVFTAVLASLVLGTITLIVVIVSHKSHINPDNVATPIAASLGDVTTLGILSAISSYLYTLKEDDVSPAIIIGVFLALIPVWVYLSYINRFVRQVLFMGWIPIILALIITSVGGFILEFSILEFKGLAIFQPVINGVAGNLVAVQASRISTYFHKTSEKPGTRPPDGSSLCVTPFSAFFGKCAHSRTARILMLMVIPGHLLFGYGITWVKGGDTVLTPAFLPVYLSAAFIQIAVLLYIAQCLIQILWRLKIDPDNSAIPLLTALGDLSGMACLTAAFYIHRFING